MMTGNPDPSTVRALLHGNSGHHLRGHGATSRNAGHEIDGEGHRHGLELQAATGTKVRLVGVLRETLGANEAFRTTLAHDRRLAVATLAGLFGHGRPAGAAAKDLGVDPGRRLILDGRAATTRNGGVGHGSDVVLGLALGANDEAHSPGKSAIWGGGLNGERRRKSPRPLPGDSRGIESLFATTPAGDLGPLRRTATQVWARPADAMTMSLHIDQLLQGMVKWDASDLHLKVGSPPGVRLSGHIKPIQNMEPLKPAQTVELMKQILNEAQIAEFEQAGDLDCAYSIPGLARFRVNVMKQRGSVSLVIRKIPVTVPDLEQLGLPAICKDLAMKPRGLVLVTGPTGSGKSTTLAAMIDYRNRNERGHILTMEDPVEFVHQDKLSYVNQREIGSDTKSFASALRRALRQDPDVILVGEMRDLETIALGITAAETGHLVFGTLHTTGAAQTIDRIIDVFPPDQQEQVRVQLASNLQGVISQVLLPKVGGGRVAAHEIMIAVDAIRACIREGKVSQMSLQMQTGSKLGMVQLDAALGKLVQEGTVDMKEALAKANNPELFKRFAGKGGAPVEVGA